MCSTKDIKENGQILAYEVHHEGSLTEMCRIDAWGTSTCYLTIDRDHRHLIAVNYWDSTLVVIPLLQTMLHIKNIKFTLLTNTTNIQSVTMVGIKPHLVALS
jgi:6-phosphogluconolactonase (cycloisomerase 2 family)